MYGPSWIDRREMKEVKVAICIGETKHTIYRGSN
jgi:hypothetical protein